jgi:DNA-binding IclR family transcriptional regulator
VFNHEGKVVASVGVTSLRTGLPDEALDGLGAKVKAAALSISHQLGYSGKRKVTL